MSENHDLLKYRQSKIIVQDLKNLRNYLKDYYKVLNKYKKYTPIRPILNEILSAECILKLHHDKQLEILNTKGKINEST